MSIILFLAAVNIIIEYVCVNHNFEGTAALPMKAFMDDLFLMSPSIPKSQELLNRCVTALSWANMSFCTAKSRSMVIKKGIVSRESSFTIEDEIQLHSENIPPLHLNPIKFLGRTINSSLSDTDAIEKFIAQIIDSLKAIDSSAHRGIHKVWFLHHILIPRARWPLLIYEVSLSVVFKLEQKISVYIRKWLKLHNSITNVALYSSISPCPLPLKSLSSILKSSKVSGHLLLRDSSDPFVALNVPALKSGAWKVADAVNSAENQLEFKKILGYHQSGRAGFGSVKQQDHHPQKGSPEYRKQVCDIIYENEDESFQAKAVQQSLQGNWTKWCNYIKLDLSWKTLIAQPQCLISFCIGATYNTLPAPSNLVRWNLSKDTRCSLCFKPSATIAHILGACKIALEQGRFTYRHDSVLGVFIRSINDFLLAYKPTLCQKSVGIKFVPEG